MIDFPTSPTIGQAYTYASRTWIWDGSAWSRQVNAGQNVSVFTVTETLVENEINVLAVIANAFQQVNYI